MKKAWIFLFAALMVAPALFSQESYLELVRSDLKTQHVALVTENMKLTDAQSQTFWPIFRKYDAEMTTLNDQAIALIKDYAANFDKMTDPKATELMKGSFGLMDKRLKLLNKTCEEIGKALGPVIGARFMQIERQILAAVDLQIASQIPLIKK